MANTKEHGKPFKDSHIRILCCAAASTAIRVGLVAVVPVGNLDATNE
jgi:hypothetical protein